MSALLLPLRQDFLSAAGGVSVGERRRGPFYALGCFEAPPSQDDLEAVIAEADPLAKNTVFLNTWCPLPPGVGPPVQGWNAPCRVSGLRHEWFCSVDYEKQLSAFEGLARLAWLSLEEGNPASRPTAEWGRRPRPHERWICFVFQTLHRAKRLSATSLKLASGTGKLLWFDGDAFAASVAAIDLHNQRSLKQKRHVPSTTRRPSPTDARGEWMYKKWLQNWQLKRIRTKANELAKRRGWSVILEDRAVHTAIVRYCKKLKIKMPRRKPR
jgi:hypothetical protein